MVPRANAASLERLEKRLLDYVSEGGGGGGGIYLDYARSWVKGVVGATLQQVVTHQVGGKDGDPEAEDGEGEDETELTLPGRVYYIKPRKLHGGATIKEVRARQVGGPGTWEGNDRCLGSHLLFAHACTHATQRHRCCGAACARTFCGRCTTSWSPRACSSITPWTSTSACWRACLFSDESEGMNI